MAGCCETRQVTRTQKGFLTLDRDKVDSKF
jgi:hypothetical protein